MKFEKKFHKKFQGKIRQNFGKFFSFLMAGVLGGVGFFVVGNSVVAAADLLDEAFQPAMQQNFLLNLGNTKSEVGAAVFRETNTLGFEGEISDDVCEVAGQSRNFWDPIFREQFCQAKFGVRFVSEDSCAGGNPIKVDEMETFCRAIGGNVIDGLSGVELATRPPLIISVVRLILRMTVVLAVTMLLFYGVQRVWHAQDADGKIKEIQKKLLRVVVGLVIALASVVIVELASSISFGTFTEVIELTF